MASIDYIWEDRQHFLIPGPVFRFVKYGLSRDRLFCETGLASTRQEEIELYRVVDYRVDRTFWQKLWNLGTIHIESTDRTTPHMDLVNILNPEDVKEMIRENAERAKTAHAVLTNEHLSAGYSFPEARGRNALNGEAMEGGGANSDRTLLNGEEVP